MAGGTIGWDITKFCIGKKLGEGQFGAVFLVKEKKSNFVMALKMVNKTFIKERDFANQLKREIEIQSHLTHPNIIRLYGYFHDENRVYIMLEYAQMGELYSDINKYGGFNDQRTATYLYQILHALGYCHSKNVLHRDIKPENIMMSKDGQIKLADFGWSVHNKSGIRTTFCGTQDYLAPEMCACEVYGNKVDIWCVGVLCFEMLCAEVPFQGESNEEVVKNITHLNYVFPGEVCAEARDLISMVLRIEPNDRPDVGTLLETAYVELFAEKNLDKCQAALDQWDHPMPDVV